MSGPPEKRPASGETSGSVEASKSTVARESTGGFTIYFDAADLLEVADIKDQVTIFSLAAILFPDWNPRSGFSPLRPDRKPGSFSVYGDGKRWKDFSTGEGGSVVDFLCKARGCKTGEAIRELRDMIRGNRVPEVAVTSYSHEPGFAGAPYIPHLRKPSRKELGQLSEARSIAIAPGDAQQGSGA